MNDKNGTIQIVMIAFAVALVITFGVKLLLTSTSSSFNPFASKKDLSMADIPLMIKESKKQTEVQVLMAFKDIKKNSKITLKHLSWKKWPLSSVQSHYIAKDTQGAPLNNSGDYKKALAMWAANDIPAGVPLTIKLLTSEDPQKKMDEEEKARQLRESQKASAEFIKKGMRAVTFPIDQRSASSLSMLAYNDLVDILIMERRGDKVKTHKYKALKILAIDGATKFIKKIGDNKENEKGDSKKNNKPKGPDGSTTVPKNITLEVKESFVDTILKQLGNGGVILSIRSSTEIPKPDGEDGLTEEETMKSIAQEALLQNIMNMNKMTSAAAIVEERDRKKRNEKDLFLLVKNMNAINSGTDDNKKEKPEVKPPEAKQPVVSAPLSSERIEIVSGKAVGKEASSGNVVIMHRKLSSQPVPFDEYGRKIRSTGGNSEITVPKENAGAAHGNQDQTAASIKTNMEEILRQESNLIPNAGLHVGGG